MPQFRIIVVGAGIAGLTMAIALKRKGHEVTVLERHPGCQALGGPVSFLSSATRVLTEYGMKDIMSTRNNRGTRPVVYRRYEDGRVLAKTVLTDIDQVYGHPTWSFSRYRLQEALAEVAEERGVNIIFNSPVSSIDENAPAIILKDGTRFEADLIVGTDGFRSVVRDVVVGEQVQTVTSFSAYNIDIPRSIIKEHPELEHLLEESNFWMGPKLLVVGLNMTDHGDKMNLCLVSEEPEGKEGEWYTIGDLEKVKAKFSQFEPNVRKMLELADPKDCYIWRLSSLPPLKKWVSDSGKVVVAGDAAHAMLPYTAMGASQCIEDSACLAECIDRASTPEDFPKLLQAFEKIRRPRVEHFVARGKIMARISHLEDGEEQKKRDERFATVSLVLPDKTWDGKNVDDPPKELFGPLEYAYNYGYDIFDYTKRRLDQILA